MATPHHGTPLANHFLSIQGQTLLLVLSALATSGQGRGTLLAAAKAVALVARLDDWLGRAEGPLDRIADALLRRLRFDRGDPVWAYLAEIERDQGAVIQLTPEGIALFDAAVADRPGIDYGCIVAGVPKPREQFKAAELFDPEYIALRAFFRLLHAFAARPHPHYPYPKPNQATQRRLERGLGFKVTPATNDGVVPSLSQLHGRLLHVARADHLDVVGHYTLAGGRTADWLPSGRRLHARGLRGHLGRRGRRDRTQRRARSRPRRLIADPRRCAESARGRAMLTRTRRAAARVLQTSGIPHIPDDTAAMDFSISDDHRAIREGVSAVVRRFDDDYWLARDDDGEFPREFHRAMADAGWLGITMPPKYGGAGLGVTEAAIMMHEVASHGGGMAAASAVHINLFGPHPIVVFGTRRAEGALAAAPGRRARTRLPSASPSPTPGLNTTAHQDLRAQGRRAATWCTARRSGPPPRRWPTRSCC